MVINKIFTQILVKINKYVALFIKKSRIENRKALEMERK